MSQGKLEVVKQEMAKVNISILGISEIRWTGWISLQSKGLSRVFTNKSINSSVLSFLHSPTLTSIHDHWKREWQTTSVFLP